MQVTHFSDYREYLKSLLSDRINSNSNYSMRAFARDLEMGSGRLSDILNGKKGVSFEAASEIATRLGMNESDTSYFCDLVVSIHARSEKARGIAKARINSMKENPELFLMQMDAFHVIADWYHFAILELTFIKDFKSDFSWIASKLDISKYEVEQAIRRLVRLGLLEVKDGQFYKAVGEIDTPVDFSSDAIKKMNMQLLDKAKDALYVQDIKNRNYTTMTMAIDKGKLDEAKKLINKFKHDICAFLEDGKQESVYCFSTQLFELTKENYNNDGER